MKKKQITVEVPVGWFVSLLEKSALVKKKLEQKQDPEMEMDLAPLLGYISSATYIVKRAYDN